MAGPWDKYQQPQKSGRPWENYSSQSASTSTPEPSFLQGIQNSFDQNTRTSPNEPLLETGLKSVVGAIGSPFVHPLDTAKGFLDMIPSSPDLPNTPMRVNGQTYLRDESNNPIVDRGIQAYHDVKDGGIGYAGTKLAGEGFGGLALGEAIGSIPDAAKGLGSKLSSIRDASIGDQNAAALRGLRVGPASNKAIRTISAVEGSRPFLQGAKDLADLQSRIPVAKNEIWSPYSETIDKIGNKQTKLGTVRDLENRRMEISAQVRALKSGDPQAVALANQKGLSQADLLAEERSIKSVLDPELRSAGIDPVAIRKSFSDVGTIDRRVAGKSTIAETDKPYGLSKIPKALEGVDITKPSTYLKPISNLYDASRDIAAGRYSSAKPTDVAIREAFRSGGPKPQFRTTPFAPEPKAALGYLEANTIGEPGGEDFSIGSIPSRPSIITPAPSKNLALPASSSFGEVQPMVGIRRAVVPEVSGDFSRSRIQPTIFRQSEIIPPRGYVVSPQGNVTGNPLFLEANEPRGLLSAPIKKSRKSK